MIALTSSAESNRAWKANDVIVWQPGPSLQDTRIFSIQLCWSAEFLIRLYALIQVTFWSIPLSIMFLIYRSVYPLFSAYLHRNYTQERNVADLC